MNKPSAGNLDLLRRQLQRLVSDEQERVASPGMEKRRHTRHLYMVEAHVRYVKRFNQVGNCPNEFTVYTKDLSRSGLSFLHEHEMYAGEVVQLEVKIKADFCRTFLVRVARCRRAGLKVFNVACEFINDDEAKAGTDQPSAATEVGPADPK